MARPRAPIGWPAHPIIWPGRTCARCAAASTPRASRSSRSWRISAPRVAPSIWRSVSRSAPMPSSATARRCSPPGSRTVRAAFTTPSSPCWSGCSRSSCSRSAAVGQRLHRPGAAGDLSRRATPPGRVLAGNIVRGRTDTIRAVIWYSDLQGFTRLSDTLPRAEILALLNEYVEPVVEAVDRRRRRGAQVHGRRHPGDLRRPPAGRGVCGGSARLRAGRRRHRCRQRTAPWPERRGDQALHRPARGRGVLRQFRRPDAARLHRARPRRQRGRPDRRPVPLARPDRWSSPKPSPPAAATDGDRLVGLGRYALRGVGRPQMLWTLDANSPS